MDLQVDMFEVQLGAAVLLQFRMGKDTVRVLADAGTSMGGYGPDYVLDKLKTVLPLEAGKPAPRIDLLVGTHYDYDHLNRMVPVIQAYDIGEAWLPPVANDTQPPASASRAPRAGDLLGAQFAGRQGAARLHAYLGEKAKAIRGAQQLRGQLRAADGSGSSGGRVRLSGKRVSLSALAAKTPAQTSAAYDPGFFEEALDEAAAFLGESADHAAAEVRLPLDAQAMAASDPLAIRASPAPGIAADAAARTLAALQRTAAGDAINAKALATVVVALKQRKVPTHYRYVEDGQPAFHAWIKSRRRFERSASLPAGKLGIALLGPSRGLIEKYWKRLPQIEYSALALSARLPVEDITASNQLSYAMVFRLGAQRMLIAGDSGFVDFTVPGRRGEPLQWHPALIAQLRAPLQVVQVAHHGGHNKYFYQALLAAGYPLGRARSYLLLSHETKAKTRPSAVFAEFIARLGDRRGRVRLLFTSPPRAAAVKPYRQLIAALAPARQTLKKGDVRLVCANGKWRIARHAVKP